jgi:hypothetical protein
MSFSQLEIEVGCASELITLEPAATNGKPDTMTGTKASVQSGNYLSFPLNKIFFWTYMRINPAGPNKPYILIIFSFLLLDFKGWLRWR